jgi:hypothetical protein
MNISDIKRMGIIFPVYDRLGDVVAHIKPVNNVGMIIPYVDKIARARNDEREFFYYQGLVSPETTMTYFKLAIQDPARIQFVLYQGNLPLGNYGLRNYGQGRLELDNALNWAAVRGLFGYFDRLLYDIAFTILDARMVQAKVLSSNVNVILWHEKGGMRNVDTRPMMWDESGRRYREVEEGEIPNTPMTVTVMEIRKEWWKK